ncbi:hypothetical protein [Streptomyces sp. AC495_CC817]|uniref:hypothetical protein n=1 Tax=Streptomyces sp. AC495_CC817 TaxID=2823900 RepID=UPI001C25F01A|nr:hypothetical protein [Streptomyces sp. AC495_CC817]
MHVDNWPKGIQPKRTEGEGPGPGRGGSGSGSGSGSGASDGVVWPDAAGRTGAVSQVEARPWEQPDQPGRNHDPHEVTVQLDGVGREVEEGTGRHAGKNGDPAGAGQDSDGPVFVDESGRRRNLYRRLGIAVGTACAAYAVVIVGTLVSGNSDAPWLPVPMQKDDKPAGRVDTPPEPAESDDRSDTADGFVPDAGPGGGRAGATVSPGGKSPTGASGRARQPEESAGAEPSAAPSAGVVPQPKPSTSAKDPEPSASASEPPKVDPTPSDSPSPAPSDTTDPGPAPDGGGTDTVAGGPASPAPVEPAPATSDSSQSPQEPTGPQDPQNPETPA